jgi:hypothetical protein
MGVSAAARALPCDFYARTPALSFRALVFLNAVVLGLLPAIVLVLIPLPDGYRVLSRPRASCPRGPLHACLSAGCAAACLPAYRDSRSAVDACTAPAQEQGIFYKDVPFLVVMSAFSLGLSALIVALRFPLRYRVTRTKVCVCERESVRACVRACVRA